MLGLLTNAINVLLLFLVAAAPLLPRPEKPIRKAAPFWLRSFFGIGIGAALAEIGKRLVIWPHHPSFPSGHETLALAAGTCLALWNPRWLALALPLAAVQAAALVIGHFHRPSDVAGALATGLLPPLACHLLKRAPAS